MEGCATRQYKKNPKFLPLLNLTWEKSSSTNRGLQDANAAENSKQIDALLQHISHYGPSALQRDITKRSTSLTEVWTAIRSWAGLKSLGSTFLAYYWAKRSWNPETILYVDFYYKLFNASEDCMLLASGQIKYEGEVPRKDEEISAYSKSRVVMDWLDAILVPRAFFFTR